MPIPDHLENVTVSCKPNLYFDGKVISYRIDFPDGSRKTIGIIYAGTYHFGTQDAERMEIVDGTCMVKLDDHDQFRSYDPGEHFDIPANNGFDIAVEDGHIEYVCSYFPA
jgi:hypothetical protein